MRPISFTTTALASASTTYLAASQTPLAAGNLTLTSNASLFVSKTSVPRYGLLISINCAGSDAARTFTVTGTEPGGTAQTETLAGSIAGQTLSTLYWEGVTQIAVDAATAGAVTAGIRQAGATAWLPLDIYVPNAQTAIQVDVSGTINYSVVYTIQDPFDPAIEPLAIAHPTAGLTAGSTDVSGQTTVIMRAVRLLINSGGGTAKTTIVQQSTL